MPSKADPYGMTGVADAYGMTGVADPCGMTDGALPREINMNELGKALTRLDSPPVMSMMIWNCNPAAVTPNSNLVRKGLERSDLFTVVHEQLMTDTARYADILLPATTQAEHLDLHFAYGHLYAQLA